LGEFADEMSAEIAKSKERLDGFWDGPISNSTKFDHLPHTCPTSPLEKRSTFTEEILIRDAISQVESRINGIDVTTAKIQLLLSNLAEQKARAQAYRDKHKVLVAPVWHRDIPPEIFLFCVSPIVLQMKSIELH